jgi:hypothetical protein
MQVFTHVETTPCYSPTVGTSLLHCIFITITFICRSRDSSVGIATGYVLDDREVGVRVLVGSRIFSSPLRPDGLSGPPSLLSNEYRGLSPRGKSGRGMKLTNHLQLLPRSEYVDRYIHFPIRLHGLVFN